jgi:hypothetical protein
MNAVCEHFAGIGGNVSLASGIIVAFDQRSKVVRAPRQALLRCMGEDERRNIDIQLV